MVERQSFDMMNSNMSEEDDVRRTRGEEINSDSSNSNSIEDQRQKRKRYHRHTPRQILEMEAFFKECPHPDDRQRKELSSELGMEPLQVKFWFQNKRTQMKTQHEHQENTQLRTENEKLRAENMRYREALSNASCPTCGGPTPLSETSFHQHQLRMENARLREEIDHISAIATNYVGKPFANSTEAPSSSTLASFKRTYRPTDLGRPVMDNAGWDIDGYRVMAIELAVAATEEVIRIAQVGEPLWVPSMDRNATLLNEDEYLRSFSRVFGLKLDGFKCEASRESVVVAMSAPNVIEILMDVEKWSHVFSGVVSRAKNMQVISSRVGENYNEALQVMNAEFHVPSPLVPTRESYFLRYCKQQLGGDTWTVADVSLDGLHSATPLVACRRRPSGCVIQDMPNGYSKVTWMEHVEVEDGGVHNIYKPLITAGLAFGAKRWVAILDAHSHRLQKVAAAKAPPRDLTYLEGRNSILQLGERMVTRFCSGVNASSGNSWTTLSGNGSENVRVMTRNNMDDFSMPFGLHLTIAISFWLPIPPKKVFDFLRDPHTRKAWDMLSNGGDVEEMLHIVSGKEVGNSVAIYQAKSGTSRQTTLVESRTDPTASYVVYTPVDMVSVNAVLGGGDPNSVPLLPSGFAILPDGPTGGQGRGLAAEADSGGSLLTVALQVLVDPNPNAKVSLGSITVANNLISCTVDKIKTALIPKSS
ncbi:Homeobox-leucine zipper protein PROTODERMAL FACTOR 2 [Sesamum angolense]|uniref:Homeobox-leucine zipper protein PROTODERMAL FACTOR 2 n=1 Tax=Sesamum angolense TaxID=2727404 RepID=A0AAE2BI01_9LAMI|nr:Homeobox-leucine zipper protein PROTODERMAL FACTOR 2 [Sesamum angolense]